MYEAATMKIFMSLVMYLDVEKLMLACVFL